MNKAINYFQECISSSKQSLVQDFQKEDTDTLIKEAYKIDSAFKIMNFCTNECSLNFAAADFSSDASQHSQTRCFNSWTTKTFEAKQFESFQRNIE